MWVHSMLVPNKGGADLLVTLILLWHMNFSMEWEYVVCLCSTSQGYSDLIGPLGYAEQCAHHNYFGKAFYFCSCAHDLQGVLAKVCREMCVRAQLVLVFGM